MRKCARLFCWRTSLAAVAGLRTSLLAHHRHLTAAGILPGEPFFWKSPRCRGFLSAFVS